MTTPPPLLKPRHGDGRLMTEDEIRGLDGRALDVAVGVFTNGDDPDLYEPDDSGDTNHSPLDYSTDIWAAFTVDRPEWRWEMEDYDRENLDLMVIAKSVNTQGAIYEQHLGRKATPADYARARCVAALLLAAKIGE